ncbi:FtsJ methyltransferase domain-containing protein 2, partial [Physocladia obscura]
MSVYANDSQYQSTTAESLVPPPRMTPPSQFNFSSNVRVSNNRNVRERDHRGQRDYHDYHERDRDRDRDYHKDRERDRNYNRDYNIRDRDSFRSSQHQQQQQQLQDQFQPTLQQFPQNYNSQCAQQSFQQPPLHSVFKIVQSAEWFGLESVVSTSPVSFPVIDIDMRKACLPNFDLFCYNALVSNLARKRIAIAALDQKVLVQARSATNAFALVSDAQNIFINRAAIKMANLDALTNADGNGGSIVSRMISTGAQTGGKLRFVDLCSGPGGFSEYILFRLRRKGFPNKSAPIIRGYGITLRGELDFDESLIRRERDFFVPFYGRDGTGDLTILENLDAFANRVVGVDQKIGRVALVTADGAFSCAGDEGNQENHVKLVLLAEILAMFKVLRRGGDFVIKTFELLTPFSVGLVYILYKSFKRISISKPFSSRPANSERYIICQDLVNPPPVELIQQLSEGLKTLRGLRQPPAHDAFSGGLVSSHTIPPAGFIPLEERIALGLFDIYSLINVDDIMKNDEAFVEWIKESNVKITMRQIEALEKIENFVRDGTNSVSNSEQQEISK